jgi:hypothetical protein
VEKKGKIAKNEIITMGIYIVQVIESTSDAHEIVASPVRALKVLWLVIATSIGLNTDPSAAERRGGFLLVEASEDDNLSQL